MWLTCCDYVCFVYNVYQSILCFKVIRVQKSGIEPGRMLEINRKRLSCYDYKGKYYFLQLYCHNLSVSFRNMVYLHLRDKTTNYFLSIFLPN